MLLIAYANAQMCDEVEVAKSHPGRMDVSFIGSNDTKEPNIFIVSLLLPKELVNWLIEFGELLLRIKKRE